jgi:hypothetical protein
LLDPSRPTSEQLRGRPAPPQRHPPHRGRLVGAAVHAPRRRGTQSADHGVASMELGAARSLSIAHGMGSPGWLPCGLAGVVPNRPGRAPLRGGPKAMWCVLAAAPALWSGSSAGSCGYDLDEASLRVRWHRRRRARPHGRPWRTLPRPETKVDLGAWEMKCGR